LAVAGQRGVKAVLDILANEIRQTLILMGVAGVAELERGHVSRRN
jgi:isopentenyl diphosphate isomerase/L-lactate dehydrogenase-like FMN-dependent dehydrogenase